MNPLLENVIVAAIVGGAVGFFVVRFFLRRRNAGKGCGEQCGCGTKSKVR